MSTATTEREIFDHALTAVCEITPADVGVVLQPDGGRYLHGDPALARALADATVRSRCCLGRPGGMTSDFAAVGLPGLAFVASATYGSDAVLPLTGSRLSEDWEYDLDLQFRADRLPLPEWLKPLQLRGRVAFVDRYLGQSVNSLTEYRVILNYELTWQGPRRR